MEAKTIIILIVIIAAVLLMMYQQAIPYIEKKLGIKLTGSAYYRIVVISATVISIYVGMNAGNTDSQDTYNSPGYEVSSAYTTARAFVKKNLKCPSTAEFASILDIKYSVNDDGSVSIISYVDSQNGFGATVRTNFSCKIKDGRMTDFTTW